MATSLKAATTEPKKKEQDPLAQVAMAAAFTPGFQLLNVLVIADSLEGMFPVMSAGANSYFFTRTEKSHGKFRPISRLKDYKGLLDSKFDLVIGRMYDKEHYNYVRYNGIYLTMSLDADRLGGYYEPTTKCTVISHSIKTGMGKVGFDFIKATRDLITNTAKNEQERVHIPDIDKIKNLSFADTVTITHKGIKTNPYSAGLLGTYNDTISVYDSLFTTYRGVVDASQKFPSTAFIPIADRAAHLGSLGFTVDVDEKARVLSERTASKYRFLTTPLMQLLPQQLLGYIKEGDATALKSVARLGIAKGKTYPIRVGWQKRVDTTPEQTVKRGYMTVTVNGHTLFEDREQDVIDYITAFGLPKVQSMADAYPDVLNIWTKKAQKLFPFMEPFQIEDVALSATKNSIYFAHDRSLGKTLMTASWAKLRGYGRVGVAAQGQYLKKWESELKKFGFKYEWLNDWAAVTRLKERIKSGVKFTETTFFLCSFEFLGLESNIRMDPWTCVEKDSRGYLMTVVKDIRTSKCPSCGKTVGQARNICPKCGSNEYSGRFCRACNTPSYSYMRQKPLTPEICDRVEREHRAGKSDFSSGSYPAYKKLKKLFKAFIIDEAQMVKNKNTLRSTATRSIHAKGRLLVTANLMKNWPNELYWPVSWLLGFNNPMFPYKHTGGYPFFAEQFGTEIYKGINKNRQPEWQRVPEVSNLTIIWKLMAPFMVRRLKTDFKDVPKPDIKPVYLDMDDSHHELYMNVRKSKLDELSKELLKENPDARILGANLWSLRGASTIPVAGRYFPHVPCTYSGKWNKLNWIVEKATQMQKEKKKGIVFTTLVDMAEAVKSALDRANVSCVRISQRDRSQRFEMVTRFNNDSTTMLVSSADLIGRCYDIEKADVVIFADCGWTPEEHEQAMDRAQRILLSTKPVEVRFLLNNNTIDIHMYDMVVQKGEAIKNVLDRRAVYKPVQALTEAVQVRVAKAIIAEKHTARPKTVVAAAPPVKPANMEEVWKKVEPIVAAEQLSLFGEAPKIVLTKNTRGKAA